MVAQDQQRKVNKLSAEVNVWKSQIRFIQDEIVFINHLINSYVFEPKTPNLFERLQGYKHYINKSESNIKNLCNAITTHERELGGMLECTDDSCDLVYWDKHMTLKLMVAEFTDEFRNVKMEVFNYAGGILKQRKT